MEANTHTFQSTMHAFGDTKGRGSGNGRFATPTITGRDYGPGSHVIDTNHPFRVHTYFRPGSNGAAMPAEDSALRILVPCCYELSYRSERSPDGAAILLPFHPDALSSADPGVCRVRT